MTVPVPAWEVTLLRRPPGSSRARVAGRLAIEAADLDQARRAAEAALTRRREETRSAGEGSVWSLGVLRPLTPRAPGTRRYLVTFALWEAHEDRFERHDVHECEIWAADAASARRLAHREVQALPHYRPAWRVRSVARDTAPELPADG
ncbi:MAG TPA: hypothetical protein VNT51_10230 [Miltoncostaeaceae bacterium]|nr:hypothetical protein [Miltoncostaeaceae bacterium]